MGVIAHGEGTAADLSDVVVRDTRPRPSDLRFGRGLEVQEGARITGTRMEVLRPRELAVSAFDGATVVLRDVTLGDVQSTECASARCAGAPLGYGATALSATLSLTRFRVAAAAVCGVMVAPPEPGGASSLDLATGVISESVIGACVQVDGYDLGRLTNDVEYRDNGTNLDATLLPVPGIADAVAP